MIRYYMFEYWYIMISVYALYDFCKCVFFFWASQPFSCFQRTIEARCWRRFSSNLGPKKKFALFNCLLLDLTKKNAEASVGHCWFRFFRPCLTASGRLLFMEPLGRHKKVAHHQQLNGRLVETEVANSAVRCFLWRSPKLYHSPCLENVQWKTEDTNCI